MKTITRLFAVLAVVFAATFVSPSVAIASPNSPAANENITVVMLYWHGYYEAKGEIDDVTTPDDQRVFNFRQIAMFNLNNAMVFANNPITSAYFYGRYEAFLEEAVKRGQ